MLTLFTVGSQDCTPELDPEELRVFTRAVLDDLAALERMLAEGAFTGGERHIGAEQELFLVDAALKPAPVAVHLLERQHDARLVCEMARFNLEANLTPRRFGGRCLRELEAELDEVVALAREDARRLGARVVMAGILPTLRQGDLGLENMMPHRRYLALNEAMTRLRGGRFDVHITGADELITSHANVMMESCNTSFQVHYQVAPEEFAHLYNLAQAVTAPVLAAAVNAPLLFGRRLWQETRIALFERSVDERAEAQLDRSRAPRVTFGDRWIDDSVLEIFREDVARFRIVLLRQLERPSTQLYREGRVPELPALTLHNGTVYRWNRPCYGLGPEPARPHLRIEQRALPAGPTVIDEMANAALWLGLLAHARDVYGPVEKRLAFAHGKANFFAAARSGLEARLTWIDGRPIGARELLLEELLPIAREGLTAASIDPDDVARYLDVVEARVQARRTGAVWMLASAEALSGLTAVERDREITAAMIEAQRRGEPVHTWPPLEPRAAAGDPRRFDTIGQLMTTDLYTVRPDDAVELAASVMEWQEVRHIPVEDERGHLRGVVSHRALVALVARAEPARAVADVMDAEPPRVTPETSTVDALRKMVDAGVSCLPVIVHEEEGDRLVGLVTERDFMRLLASLLQAQCASPPAGTP